MRAPRATDQAPSWGIQLRHRHPRRQGDLGEAAAIHWLTGIGANVSVPLFHSPDYDLVVEIDETLRRVQVKTSTCELRSGRYEVTLATRGGNRSWTGVVKRFDSDRCDWLFVLVADGRRWFIPARVVGGRTAIILGGPKYAGYEVANLDGAAQQLTMGEAGFEPAKA